MHSVQEMNIISVAFVPKPSDEQLTLAILHEDYQGKIKLCGRDVNAETADVEFEYSEWVPDREVPDGFVDRLIPIPFTDDRPGGLLVAGGSTLFFYPLQSPQRSSKGKQKRRKPSTSLTNATGDLGWPAAQTVDWPYSNVTA